VIVAVVGKGGEISPDLADLAYTVGRKLGSLEPSPVVVTGGLGGTMAEVARGASEEGLTVVSLVPIGREHEAHPHATFALRLGLPEPYRNVALATCAEAMIMLPGNWGTCQEAVVFRETGRPFVWVGDHAMYRSAAFARGPGDWDPVSAIDHLAKLCEV
jgi:uncharacterized protein (TIGR00725 family)